MGRVSCKKIHTNRLTPTKDTKDRSKPRKDPKTGSPGKTKTSIEAGRKIKEFIETKGGKMLTMYRNGVEAIKYECEKGHLCSNRTDRIYTMWCSTCKKLNRPKKKIKSRQESSDNFYKVAEERGFKVIGEYVNSYENVEMICNKGHRCTVKPYNFNRYVNCRQCVCPILTIEDCIKHAKNKGGECLSNNYKNGETKMSWRCKDGHEWLSCFDNMKKCDVWCPFCGDTIKSTLEDAHKLAEQYGGICISEHYKNAQQRLRWKCSKGHMFMSKMNHINTGYWCPQCRGDVSHGEFIVSNILNQLSLKYSTQKTFSDLYSPYSSSKLICDFWISLFSLILEFDGKPHFKPCKFKKDITKEEMKKIFYEQLLRDREKDRWAKRKGKNLLRIDYKQMKSILDIIADTMVKIADNIRKNIKEPIIISPHAEWRENKIKELEKELNIIQE